MEEKMNILKLKQYGADSFPFLTEEERLGMLSEAVVAEFQKAPAVIGRVQQNFFEAEVNPYWAPITMRAFSRLEQCIRDTLAAQLKRTLGRFFFNEHRFHRYPVGPVGISGHRDEAKFQLFIAVFVLAGKGDFRTHVDREGKKPLYIYEQPGHCILIPTLGFFDDDNSIPFHSVVDISEERTVVAARFDSLKSGL
ncbi:MAG TPA: hypothetical protein VLB02_02595 [Candidatus Paceibacterota bacterium]|nr:hypothetical protein [Candidatus Paceibacterota bacterium]